MSQQTLSLSQQKMNIILKFKSLNNKEPRPRFIDQNREKFTQNFESRLKQLCDIQIIFPTRKLRTCLPTLKLSFNKNLKSHELYRFTCNGCSFNYVGQTSRYITTRISEHQKRIPLWENTSLNVVVQRRVLNRRFLMHVTGLKN